MNFEKMTAAIKATDSLDELEALIPSLGGNEELLALAKDHEGLLFELDCFAPVTASKAIADSKAAPAGDDEEEEEYVPSARKLAAVAAAVAEAAAPVEIKASLAVAPVVDPLADKKALRADLMAKVAACVDADALEALAHTLDLATRAGQYLLLREEVIQAYKARYKTLAGFALKASLVEGLFPKAAAKRGATIASLPLTEFGVTERLKRAHGDELMFAVDVNKWYRFDEGYWKQEPSSVMVVEMARKVVKGLRPEAEAILDPEEMSEALKAVAACERTQFASGVVAGLAGEEGIATSSQQMDIRPELLCVANGIVDLRTGTLQPADPEARLTMTTLCDYDPEAKAPIFLKTLTQALNGNQEAIDCFQRVMGYALMANPVERILVIATGKGKNGKSTIFNAMQEALGTHGTTMSSSVIASPIGAMQTANASGHSEHLVRLRGKRVIFGSELKRASVFNDDVVKSFVSGGDTIVARNLNSGSIEFKPTGVMVMPANVLPTIRDDDPAILDRLLMFKFGNRIADSAVDTALPAKLKAEKEGILAWMVQGALAYQKMGLAVPACVSRVKEEARDGASPIGLFMEDMCELGAEYVATADELFDAWKIHSFEQGVKHLAQEKVAFGKAICSHGTIEAARASIKGQGQKRVYLGIKLVGTNHQLPKDFWQKRLAGM